MSSVIEIRLREVQKKWVLITIGMLWLLSGCSKKADLQNGTRPFSDTSKISSVDTSLGAVGVEPVWDAKYQKEATDSLRPFVVSESLYASWNFNEDTTLDWWKFWEEFRETHKPYEHKFVWKIDSLLENKQDSIDIMFGQVVDTVKRMVAYGEAPDSSYQYHFYTFKGVKIPGRIEFATIGLPYDPNVDEWQPHTTGTRFPPLGATWLDTSLPICPLMIGASHSVEPFPYLAVSMADSLACLLMKSIFPHPIPQKMFHKVSIYSAGYTKSVSRYVLTFSLYETPGYPASNINTIVVDFNYKGHSEIKLEILCDHDSNDKLCAQVALGTQGLCNLFCFSYVDRIILGFCRNEKWYLLQK